MISQFATQFITLEEYLKWALSEGCRVQTGFSAGPDGMMEFTVVTAKSGRYAVIHDLSPGEAIPAAAYAQYDRRLGLESPFGKTKQ
ncbi:MAG: hypothetical protein KDE14_00940 [Rhodobacteraceae bacterium]|nr:hypothetical protein [Paracoccaceae bacterium]